jgi:glucan phosphoethanolaminetransferase (alkaline phosphatase superfamily)
MLLPLATVLLALYFTSVNIFLAPVYKNLLAALDLTTPLPARLVTNAATSQWIVVGLLAAALLYLWWQQPHVRTRFPLRWLAPRTVLQLTNLALVLAVLAQGTLFLRFASDGVRVLTSRHEARTAPHQQHTR